MEIDSIEIQTVPVEEIIDLRHVVLRSGLGRESAYFDGDVATGTIHLAAKIRDRVIGCATILINEWNGERACQLRGMAVDPAFQHRGVGSRLLTEASRIAAENGIQLLWANARTPAAEFYRRHGWEIVSEEFEILTAGPHFKMIRRLKSA